MPVSALSKSISRRRADFFFGAVCFFFPLGPRWGLRAAPLSLINEQMSKRFMSGERTGKEHVLTVPTTPFDG